MKTLTAQMSSDGSTWRLYVVLYGVSAWPTFRWERSGPVPTMAERQRALAALGYEVAPGAAWSWTEDSRDLDDGTPVVLIAAVTVHGRDGGAA